jgi:hypothetical protein
VALRESPLNNSDSPFSRSEKNIHLAPKVRIIHPHPFILQPRVRGKFTHER